MKISNAEWPILTALWNHPSAAASEILPLIDNNRFSTNLGTLRTHLRRLVQKGLVTQSKEGKRHRYTSTLTMEKAVTLEVENLLENIPDESQFIAISLIIKHSTLKEAELGAIKEELEEKHSGSI